MNREEHISQTGDRSSTGTGRLNQRKALLATRWDMIVSRSCQTNWACIGIGTLATRSGLAWYTTRGDELLANFLGFKGVALVKRRGWGFRKIERLCEIIERAMDAAHVEFPTAVAPDMADFDPSAALAAWGISPNYPCHLTRLPVRLVNFCDKRNLVGIGELLSEWATLGFEGFKAQQNLGSKSVRQMERFVESLRTMDLETVSMFLPIHPSGTGLSLGRALKLIAVNPSPSEMSMLDRRLVHGVEADGEAVALRLVVEVITHAV